MRFDFHVHLHPTPALCGIIEPLLRQGRQIMAALDELTAEVEVVKTVEQSAVTLINGLAAKLEEAGTDPAKIAQVVSDLKSSSDALAAAVAANTAPPTP